MATASTRTATLDDFLRAEAEAPEGARLALIDGEIVEWGANLTTRNSRHSRAMACISHRLLHWLESQTNVIGVVACGEARCQLREQPDSVVGLDVAYFAGERHLRSLDVSDTFLGPPEVAVEVLSGSDTHDRIIDRIRTLLDGGVKQVWVADPDLMNVTVYRQDADEVLYSQNQMLTGGTELPGFECSVRALFQ